MDHSSPRLPGRVWAALVGSLIPHVDVVHDGWNRQPEDPPLGQLRGEIRAHLRIESANDEQPVAFTPLAEAPEGPPSVDDEVWYGSPSSGP